MNSMKTWLDFVRNVGPESEEDFVNAIVHGTEVASKANHPILLSWAGAYDALVYHTGRIQFVPSFSLASFEVTKEGTLAQIPDEDLERKETPKERPPVYSVSVPTRSDTYPNKVEWAHLSGPFHSEQEARQKCTWEHFPPGNATNLLFILEMKEVGDKIVYTPVKSYNPMTMHVGDVDDATKSRMVELGLI